MSFDKTLAQYKDRKDLEQFAVAQQNTIIQLTKKVQLLEEKNTHLEKLLSERVPVIRKEGENGPTVLTPTEQQICEEQLEKLKEISEVRELTLEETRRVEIFSKILLTFKNRKPDIEVPSKNLSTAELLKLAKD